METSTDLSVLITEDEWAATRSTLPAALAGAGLEVSDIAVQDSTEMCAADNILRQEYLSRFGHTPEQERIFRVVVNAVSTLPLHRVTSVVSAAFPPQACWYGATEIGHTEIATGLEDVRGV